jgi:hypothetical protein
MLVEPLSEREPLSYLICYFRFNVLSPAAAGCDLFIVPLRFYFYLFISDLSRTCDFAGAWG